MKYKTEIKPWGLNEPTYVGDISDAVLLIDLAEYFYTSKRFKLRQEPELVLLNQEVNAKFDSLAISLEYVFDFSIKCIFDYLEEPSATVNVEMKYGVARIGCDTEVSYSNVMLYDGPLGNVKKIVIEADKEEAMTAMNSELEKVIQDHIVHMKKGFEL